MQREDFIADHRRPTRRVAVVGAGIAGLASAWLLSQRYAVTLFEAGDYLGGHTHTVDVEIDGRPAAVDTGFLVFNRRTYPNLCALFELLGVEATPSDMSFAVSLERPALEWAGSNLATLFAQKRNLMRPAFIRMVADIVRFNREATRMAIAGCEPGLSLGDYLDRERYGRGFRDWYLLPMAAAIWSCPTRAMLGYPLATFVRFCHNHGLVQILRRPQWLSVRGGGRKYVDKLIAGMPDLQLQMRTPVKQIERMEDGVHVLSARGAQCFDEIVLACHSDQALALLGRDASAEERHLLGAVRYQDNEAVLHTDTALLPRRRSTWSAWNYLAGEGRADDRPVSVSYLLNRLQPLPFSTPLVLSLNPFRAPDPRHVIDRYTYAHPVFDQRAIEAQARLPLLQGRRRTWFAGAWTGYGFHEDGLKSAMAVARGLDVAIPWQTATAAGARAGIVT
ncbi:amine oxidoreductase [Azoarcus olearius]|uniref:NAD(P)/FAD-dependent oxidoreductase n=1 Tax=Azoarcus sp. (strain BH72) TaxID=418699 RepID=UPI00080624BB|nr:FAD-dependent oxidoreductase [Azoarcus olearius]ANQ86468.1 amine oxidoreductase [Azoarcus olearius]